MITNRCVDIVVGLAFGSEAKGKLCEHIAGQYNNGALVRTGSPNAGHYVYSKDGKKKLAFQTIPCGSIAAPKAQLVIGAGAMIIPTVLDREIGWLKEEKVWDDGRLVIDPNAILIEQKHIDAEHGKDGSKDLFEAIGSTREGCGAALIDRIKRQGDVTLAKDVSYLKPYIGDTCMILNNMVNNGFPVMLEGTQGMALSMYHGLYPKTTSRDTNAANWLAEAGLSPMSVRSIYGVMRTYPIRVAGNSGPFGYEDENVQELTWEEIQTRSGSSKPVIEMTTVTKRVRRVGEISPKLFRKALAINRPGSIMVTFIDYIAAIDYGKNAWEGLSQVSKEWVAKFAAEYDLFDSIGWLSTGPRPEHIITMHPGKLREFAFKSGILSPESSSKPGYKRDFEPAYQSKY